MNPISVKNPENTSSRELSVLHRILSSLNRGMELPEVLRPALDDLLVTLGLEAGAFSLAPSPDGLPAQSVFAGFDRETIDLLEGEISDTETVRNAWLPAERTILPDLSKWEKSSALTDSLRRQGFQFLALFPIQAVDRPVGSLILASRRSRVLSDPQEELLSTLAEMLGIAIINSRLNDRASRLSEDLFALQEVNRIVSQSLNLEDIIQRIVAEGKRLVKTEGCHLFLVDDRRQLLVGAASTQAEKPDIRTVELEFTEKSHLIDALIQQRVFAVDRLLENDRWSSRLLQLLDWRSAIFAPLMTKDQAIGVLVCSEHGRERPFSREEVFRADTLAHQAAFALERARLFQVVSRSQREWETTFDAMQDCVSVHDTKGKIIRANMALARRLQTTPNKLVGKYCSEIYNLGGPSLTPCRHIRSLRSESLSVEEMEVPILNGTFQVSVSPWYDKNNNLAGSIHVAKDISNEKLLQQQLIQSEKISAIGELISGIAHELNNPLTGVMGYSQLLQLRKDLDERAKESLLKINNLALRCQKIVQNLLSFARKQKPERTLSNINEVLLKTIDLRNYDLQVNNIQIEPDLAQNLPKTIADGHQLQQVFLNIITNAEQAMLESHGQGRLVTRTRADTTKNRIIVEIIDDGPGIPDAHITKIFDPFFTTKEVGKGTGLGLSLSYGIIKEHGGDIYVRSKPGEGCSFTVEIPIISRMEEENTAAPDLMPQALQFENLIRDKRILVVDDEQYILDFFIEVFQDYPMSIDTADNGQSALEKMKVSRYDLIISDFRMPTMGGKQLFEWIQAEFPELSKRIIFVTGDTVSNETRSFFETTSNRYIAKPFKIEEVKEVIQQTLEES